MNYGAAGEVEHLDPSRVVGGVEDAVRPPDPMGDRRIDKDRPQPDEPQHGGKFLRSANEPAISAAVMIAKVSWNIE